MRPSVRRATARRASYSLVAASVAIVALAFAPPAHAASITAIAPASGPIEGGSVVTITGTGFGFTQVSGGDDHTLALRSDNTLFSWGSNSYGQLGNGTNASSATPTPVDMSGALSGKTIVQISTSYRGSLVLASDNTLYTWGEGISGQLGNGAFTDSTVAVPVDMTGVLAGKTITQISRGAAHSVVLASDGTLFTWGNSSWYDQLGNGTSIDSAVPVAVDMTGVLAGKTIVSIDAGWMNSYVVASDGTAFSWGWGFYGQNGDGTNTPRASTPVQIVGGLVGKTVVKVSGGGSHALALTSDGELYSWGFATDGRLGDGIDYPAAVNVNAPIAVDISGVLAGRTIVDIEAGRFHSLALDSTGAVMSWGPGNHGVLGDGLTTRSLVPVVVDSSGSLSGRTVTALSAGSWHNSAVTADGGLITWGRNQHGQLGNGTDFATPASVPVEPTMPALSVTFGGVPAASITRLSATSLSVVVPPHPAGPVDVVVSVGGNSLYSVDEATSAGGYEYLDLQLPTLPLPDDGPELADTGPSDSVGTLLASAFGTLLFGCILRLLSVRRTRSATTALQVQA